MKRNDLIFLAYMLVLFLPFFLSDQLYASYHDFNSSYPYIMGFVKFAVLATTGEAIGLRIRSGVYNKPGFGLLPRAVVWGFLGLTIVMAFKIFATGGISFLRSLGIEGAAEALNGPWGWKRVFTAFTISATLNLIYAPVLMTLHKITDIHIDNTGGTLKGLLQPIRIGHIFCNLNWDVQWNFVFKRTIPLFWIPAQTITFLLPEEFRVLFAALLGIALGIILAIAALKSK